MTREEGRPNAAASGESDAAILEALPAAVFALDAEGRLLRWNGAAESLWGRRPRVGERDACACWRWPDGRPIAPGEGPLAASAPAPAEILVVRPDGTAATHMLYPRALRDAAGAISGILFLLVDISERASAEIDRERLAAIVSSSNDAIIGKTLDGIIASWNEGATRMYGYRAEEMLDKPVTLLMPEEIRDEEEVILARLRRGERVEHFDTVRVTKDGRRIDVSLAISPVRDGSGRIVGASKVARDISERKRAEELQRLLLDELNHRVKNTLATIQAIASQSLRRAPDPASFVASFSGRVQALARAHDLLVAGELRGTGVGDLVREQVLLGQGDPRVRAAGPEVRLDPRTAVQLALVLHELATNARKHGALSRAGGGLAIEWRLVVDGVRRLVLTWTEAGVAGVRAPAARAAGFGTTLINRSLETAGGVARLTYGPDGLACLLDLPLPDPAPEPRLDPPTRGGGGAPGPELRGAGDLRGRRVLVVEDEPLVAMDIQASLEAAGCSVVGPVATVAAALALVAGGPVDVAVLDANLGGSRVDALADALAAAGVPFAFATGYGREALPAAHGTAPVLTKPFAPAQLVAAVAGLVTPRNAEEA